jgi:hypothetical protein
MALLLDRKRNRLALLWGVSVPVVAVVWPVTAATDSKWIGMAAFNVLVFLVGLATLAEGVKGENLGTVNLGMSVVAMLVIVRFFDSGFGFILKGLVFIVVGIGFLGANIVLSRRLHSSEGKVP